MTHIYTCDHCGREIRNQPVKIFTYNGRTYFFHSYYTCRHDWMEAHAVDWNDEDDLDRCFIRGED